MTRNLPKTCDICFKTMRGDYLKTHILKHEKERKSESNFDNVKHGKIATKTCDICFKTMRGDNLKRHMMKHMNGRKEEKEEQKDNEVEQNYEIIRKNMLIQYAESKRKIELGRIMTDIAVKENINTSLLPKDMQEAIEAYEKFGKNIEKRDIQWKGWQQKLRGYLNEKCDRKIFWVVGREGGEGKHFSKKIFNLNLDCLLYTSPSPRDS